MIGKLKQVAKKILKSPGRVATWAKESSLERNKGYCVLCEAEVEFVIHGEWMRDNYKCSKCGSIPRNRAIILAIDKFCPDWRKLAVHESSPGGLSSVHLKKYCGNYSSSHYYADIPKGQYKGEHRSEDLTALTFPDQSFDLVVTSDVFEHVFNPGKAFAEIARVLKPGGLHIFTIPWIPDHTKSTERARLKSDGSIEYLKEAEYHYNPVDTKGSLVTYDWGLDFGDFIYKHSGMTTTIYLEIDRGKGLDAKMLEVFISRKPHEA